MLRATLTLALSDSDASVTVREELAAEASSRDVFVEMVCDMLAKLNSETVDRIVARMDEAVSGAPKALPAPAPGPDRTLVPAKKPRKRKRPKKAEPVKPDAPVDPDPVPSLADAPE